LALALLWLPALSLVEGAAEGLAGQAGATPDGVLTVCPAGPPDCDYAVIQDAVDAAADGDIIKVATGISNAGCAGARAHCPCLFLPWPCACAIICSQSENCGVAVP